ncbi:DUF1045 domain-containing protein [Yoonia sp. GPGPB17]|uniref:DUF1045 domain-containing protein n=1 Tax=Yoonia sp. GPGPB17 TaxID=3026147 RepID=UPI0030BB1BEE
MTYSRYAIYYVAPDGALADFGARWLGWDVVRGCATNQPNVPGLGGITTKPRKYGFHGTLKAPFRLAQGKTPQDLEKAVTAMAASQGVTQCAGLTLTTLGQFLALTPVGDTAGLRKLAETCVITLDAFRASPSSAEREKRSVGLTPRQLAMLTTWGYPYVMDEFRFHLTLSGALDAADIDHWKEIVQQHLPSLPAPFIIDAIALCGERQDGQFELIRRYDLTG